ncbi:MAG: hypothetical protein KF819_39595 [Labilithrix sp.]|nr:hypothetical protein [Labilithrix sp.]
MTGNRCAMVLVAWLATTGCSGAPAEDPSKLAFAADVVVSSDPGQGIAGAELAVGGQTIASTDAEGRASLSLRGVEGDIVEIGVRCPTGFQSPPEPIAVSLRRLSSGSRAPTFASRCAPLSRTVVVGIRTDNGPNLPVLYLGKEIGRTDAWGAAHVVLTVKANEQITLGLDTTSGAEKRPRLRPENPTLTFVAKDKDDFVTLEQRFTVERPAVRVKSAPVRIGPTRL